MLTCQQFTEVVTAYVERRMSIWQRAQVQVHLGLCRDCRAYLHQMRTTIRTLRGLPQEPMPDGMKAELLERFRAMALPRRK